MNPQYLTTTVSHACLCDCNRFAVTLMKNHYTFMHIRHRTCPIHLLDYCYLFLLAVYLFPIRRGIYHTSNFHSLPAVREKGGKRTQEEKTSRWRYGGERKTGRNKDGGRWRGSVKKWKNKKSLAIFHQGPRWSCQAGVYVSPPDDNVAWHFWNERRVAMARSGEGRPLRGPK